MTALKTHERASLGRCGGFEEARLRSAQVSRALGILKAYKCSKEHWIAGLGETRALGLHKRGRRYTSRH